MSNTENPNSVERNVSDYFDTEVSQLINDLRLKEDDFKASKLYELLDEKVKQGLEAVYATGVTDEARGNNLKKYVIDGNLNSLKEFKKLLIVNFTGDDRISPHPDGFFINGRNGSRDRIRLEHTTGINTEETLYWRHEGGIKQLADSIRLGNRDPLLLELFNASKSRLSELIKVELEFLDGLDFIEQGHWESVDRLKFFQKALSEIVIAEDTEI